MGSKEFRIAEIFGPTIQGEGRLVGMPCHFVRFGGCDFRCVWCDTPHAVLPDLVAKLKKMTAWEILNAVENLDPRDIHMPRQEVQWVVLTGGNTALVDLSQLIGLLHDRRYKVMLETQGSVYRPWFADVDDLCFSPKPPSSDQVWDFDLFQRILDMHYIHKVKEDNPYLKVPIFNDGDLDFAEKVHERWPDLEMFISVGNDNSMLPTVGNPYPTPGHTVGVQPIEDAANHVLQDYSLILDTILTERPGLQDCRIFPQQHVLL